MNIEGRIVYCALCDKWWEESGMECTVSHFPGQCCHQYDKEVQFVDARDRNEHLKEPR